MRMRAMENINQAKLLTAYLRTEGETTEKGIGE